MGRELRSRNLRDSFLPAAVAVEQNGNQAAQGELHTGRVLRSLDPAACLVATGPAAASPAAINNP